MKKLVTIDSIQHLPIKGPWTTKSNANLDVLAALSHEQTRQLFTYSNDSLSASSRKNRGLRIYRVSNLQSGAIGGNEWHRIKKELIFVTKGSVRWNLSDQYGTTQEIILTPHSQSVLIPPYILHTYTALEDDSELLVLTNTLYDVDDPETHDTYPLETFPTI